ncbi:MAG: hypothetical protein GY838_08350 [bacterium]|nr:hypothetical protein [bacterium]
MTGALVCACALALLAAACTSDTPTELGQGLVTTEFDTTLALLGVENLTQFSALAIEDEDVPLKNQQLLYLGSREGNESSILINFDFAKLDSLNIPPAWMNPDSTVYVWLRFVRALNYDNVLKAPADTSQSPLMAKSPVYFELNELDAPFDSTDTYPGPEPSHSGINYNSEHNDPGYVGDLNQASKIKIDPGVFWNWYQEGAKKGFAVRSGPEADTTLVGFASREMRLHYSELEPLGEFVIAAPHFIVAFVDSLRLGVELVDNTALLTSYSDISTFHEVVPVPTDPADGIVVRTCLRNYPAMHFDFSSLPPDIYINRAELRLHNDTTRGFGTYWSLVLAEFDSLDFDQPGGSMTLDELDDAALYVVTGITAVTPQFDKTLDFNVTQYVQRVVNGVYDGSRGLLMAPDERFFSAYDRGAAEPDFYFSEYRFHGTADPDPTLRPQLRITYSSISDLEGGTP